MFDVQQAEDVASAVDTSTSADLGEPPADITEGLCANVDDGTPCDDDNVCTVDDIC